MSELTPPPVSVPPASVESSPDQVAPPTEPGSAGPKKRPWNILGRLAAAVREQNWFAVALEVIIVVLGVFIGIQVSNWNAARVDRSEERVLLTELRESLIADERELSSSRDTLEVVVHELSELREHMKAGRPYDPALDERFGIMYGAVDIGLNTGPYEQLKAGRLSLISDDALRSHIVDVFDNAYSQVEFYTRELQPKIILDKYWPFFMEHFHGVVQWETATPNDYAALIEDVYFFNLLDYRITHLRGGQLEAYDNAIDSVNQLIGALDRELGVEDE